MENSTTYKQLEDEFISKYNEKGFNFDNEEEAQIIINFLKEKLQLLSIFNDGNSERIQFTIDMAEVSLNREPAHLEDYKYNIKETLLFLVKLNWLLRHEDI